MDNKTRALLAAAGASAEKTYVEDVFSTYLYTGNGSSQTITNGIKLGEAVEIPIGTALGGGFFAGFISTSANGVATHALIVAPAATGYNGGSKLQWKTSNTSTSGTSNEYDGATSTANMADASHPAANYCAGLSIGGYSDWYLPARFELEIAYYNLKPTTTSNYTGFGANAYSVPARSSNYSAGDPAQTSVTAFQSGGAEAFLAENHWSSNENSAGYATLINFSSGYHGYPTFVNFNKTTNNYVRAFRKIAINDSLLDPYRVSGEGGLVWTKNRTSAVGHSLIDTVRGLRYQLDSSSSTSGDDLGTNPSFQGITAFNSDGYALGADGFAQRVNQSGQNYASWTFRKAPKFFDVVTYTGNDVAGRQIPHSLGATPGTIIIKTTNVTDAWIVWHRSIANNGYARLNSTAAAVTTNTQFKFGNGTITVVPTSTSFTIGNDSDINASGRTYVAYIFAHDAGGFGDSGNDNVISCGSYTGNGSATGPVIDLGWEPQWLLVKQSSSAGANWVLIDNMRGFTSDGVISNLYANTSDSETAGITRIAPLSTGFQPRFLGYEVNQSGQTYIYIAIRRGPMKTPTDATKVFNAATLVDTGSAVVNTGFPIDFGIDAIRTGSVNNCFVWDRLRGGPLYLSTSKTAAEASSGGSSLVFDRSDSTQLKIGSGENSVLWSFRRASGFFDVVAYTGDGQTGRTVSHNLGVVPELMIVKSRTDPNSWWFVYHSSLGASKYILLQSTAASTTSTTYPWNNTAPTDSVFTLYSEPMVNGNGFGNIAYLFATVPGVSKVGSYTGTGTTLDIDCGFTSGARFVLIKRTDSTGDWYVWDSARGIISGNDPYLLLNSTSAENTSTDYIDPLSSGFQISSTAPAAINANGGSFIFLAIA